jgi:hypothetical protein
MKSPILRWTLLKQKVDAKLEAEPEDFEVSEAVSLFNKPQKSDKIWTGLLPVLKKWFGKAKSKRRLG